jgi:threonine/homoserine/homoserine lactone efflux protein
MKKLDPFFVNGLRLGLLLQVGAIGPICLLIFQLACVAPPAMMVAAVFGVFVADSVYISISVVGIAKLLSNVKGFDQTLKIISGIMLLALGCAFAAHSFAENGDMRTPRLNFGAWKTFLWLFGLTLANPLTIVCFTGIFSAQMAQRKMAPPQLRFFALGTLIATPIFMSLVAVIGHFSTRFLPSSIIRGLNLLISLVLIFWGVKSILAFAQCWLSKNKSDSVAQ